MNYEPTLPSAKRWAVTDIDYVRGQLSRSTVRNIAAELQEPESRVRRLITRLKKEGRAVAPASESATPVKSVHLGARSAPTALPHGSAPSRLKAAPMAPDSAPPELLIFLRELAVREAASALGLSRGTVHNLRDGYWPKDARRILRAWAAYQGHSADRASGWFLRRVYPGGLVRHAGRDWSAAGLAVHTGKTVAVARGASAALLAQMLDPPLQRLELTPLA